MGATLDPRLQVDPTRTKAFAEVMTQFRGLDRLLIRHVTIKSWAPVLDPGLDKSLRLYSLTCKSSGSDYSTERHRIIYMTTDTARLRTMPVNHPLRYSVDGSIYWGRAQTLEACLQSVRGEKQNRHVTEWTWTH